MITRPIIIGAAAALAAMTLSGCASASDRANEAIESARAVVSSAASQASDALSQAQDRAASAASQAQDRAASVASQAQDRAASVASQAQDRAASAAAQATAAASAAASAAKSVAGQTPYTMTDVKAHNTPSDCWVAVDGRVYDLTNWRSKHPGGADKIEKLCGTDGSKKFRGQHGSDAAPNAALRSYQIGILN